MFGLTQRQEELLRKHAGMKAAIYIGGNVMKYFGRRFVWNAFKKHKPKGYYRLWKYNGNYFLLEKV